MTSDTMSLFGTTMTPLLEPKSGEARAVEGDHGVGAADAVDGVLGVLVGVRDAGQVADALERADVGHDRAGEDAQQLERAAADDREVVDLVGRQQALAGARLGLDQLALRGDLDLLGLCADLEREVEAGPRVEAMRSPFRSAVLKPGISTFIV